MKTQNYRYLLCMAVALLAACSDAGKGKESEEGVATVLPSESNEVTVKVLKRATFEHELVSNGKVTAGSSALFTSDCPLPEEDISGFTTQGKPIFSAAAFSSSRDLA